MEKGIPEEDVITCKHVLYQVLQNLIEKTQGGRKEKMNKTLLKSVREYKKHPYLLQSW